MKYQVGDVFAKPGRIVYIEKFERSIHNKDGCWIVKIFPDGDIERSYIDLTIMWRLLNIGYTHYPVKE
jgi:hypothetical protein